MYIRDRHNVFCLCGIGYIGLYLVYSHRSKRITRKKLNIKNRTLVYKSKCGYFYGCFHSADSKSQTHLYSISHINDIRLYALAPHHCEKISHSKI